MVAFELVELHSSALRDKKSESGGFHNVAGKCAYDADDRRNCSNVFQYFWLRPASDVIKKRYVETYVINNRAWRR